jgi:hypothetical protein
MMKGEMSERMKRWDTLAGAIILVLIVLFALAGVYS